MCNQCMGKLKPYVSDIEEGECDLSVDQAEANVLEAVLKGCSDFEMVFFQQPGASNNSTVNALELYDDCPSSEHLSQFERFMM